MKRPKRRTAPEVPLALLVEADSYVESLVPKADGKINGVWPWWHGWALRESYLAGVAAERTRREPSR